MKKLIALLFAILLAGCDADSLMKAFIPEEAKVGQRYLEDVRAGRYTAIEDNFNTAYVTPDMPPALRAMTAAFPKETPKSIKVIGSNTVSQQGVTTYNLTYDEFSHSWMIGNVILQRTGKHARVQLDIIV